MALIKMLISYFHSRDMITIKTLISKGTFNEYTPRLCSPPNNSRSQKIKFNSTLKKYYNIHNHQEENKDGAGKEQRRILNL